MTGKVFKTKYL